MNNFPARIMRTIIALLLLVSTFTAQAAPRVVVSLKPLHSLTAMLMQDVAEPVLLSNGAIDPHHFSLRPSQRRQLAQADLVIWVGPQLETALAKAITAQAQQLALMNAALPVRLPARSTRHPHHDAFDPHIWLSPDNARSIVEQIAHRLIALDAGHRDQYRHNLRKARQQIDTLEQQIRQQANWRDISYMAWHDSYQYFEQHFGLRFAGALRHSDGQHASARQLSSLHRQLRASDTPCVVHDSQPPPASLAGFTGDSRARLVYIDVLGHSLDAGAGLWPNLMRQMAQGFVQCAANRFSP